MATEAFETFEGHLAEALRDPEFREAWEASEPTYQVARLRILRGEDGGEILLDADVNLAAREKPSGQG